MCKQAQGSHQWPVVVDADAGVVQLSEAAADQVCGAHDGRLLVQAELPMLQQKGQEQGV